MNLSINTKIAIYSVVGAGTYLIYDKMNINSLNKRFKSQIQTVNKRFFNDFPAIKNIYESINKGENDYRVDALFLGDNRILERFERDEHDEKNYLHAIGDGTYIIDTGKGEIKMSGLSPRIYINPNKLESRITEPNLDFNYKNCELTAYFKKNGNNTSKDSGFILGLRGHANGHLLAYDTEEQRENLSFNELIKNYKFANTYRVKISFDGNIYFIKETTHYNESFQQENSDRTVPKISEIIVGKYKIPNHFIGVKFIVYNFLRNKGDRLRVKLELWIEDESKGQRHYITGNRTNWRKVAEYVDREWFWPTFINPDLFNELDYDLYNKNEIVGTGLLNRNRVLLESYGTALIGTNNSTIDCKYIELREIDPELIKIEKLQTPSRPRNFRFVNIDDTTILLKWRKPRYNNIQNTDSDLEIKDYKIIFENNVTIEKNRELTITNLNIGETYIFQIMTRNTKSNKYSEPRTIIVFKEEFIEKIEPPPPQEKPPHVLEQEALDRERESEKPFIPADIFPSIENPPHIIEQQNPKTQLFKPPEPTPKPQLFKPKTQLFKPKKTPFIPNFDFSQFVPPSRR